jgi:hypothetical protein
MYKDDQEALLARVRSLEAELAAEQTARRAVELAVVAARAREDEIGLMRLRRGEPSATGARARQVQVVLIAILAAFSISSLFSWQAMVGRFEQDEASSASSLERAKLERLRREMELDRQKLARELEETRADRRRFSDGSRPISTRAPSGKLSSPALASTGLTKTDIQQGMRAVKGNVQACYALFKIPGLAEVAVTLERGGQVSDVEVTGVFAGTPTGRCIVVAVAKARFPAHDGESFRFKYPFLLHPDPAGSAAPRPR